MYQAPPPPGGTGPIFQLNIDANTNQTLRSAATWSKIFGVFGIIIAILFAIMAFAVQAAVNQRPDLAGAAGVVGRYGLVIYLGFAIVMLVSSIFSLTFGAKISAALRSNDQYSLNSGFAAVRNYFAFWTILMILFLVLIILLIVAVSQQGVNAGY